ncbi:MAG: replication and repair protein RecF protein [Candidatus Roizmanbacteria bacterium GW2011_GWA2_36_23]|uniref:DNA replication and repair protein RecF n=1 Tax=Candidatus Roizmanbacteria bacterium GW2011_GWA2_36_23 TaxID=1618480 RepID=A0A0G0HCH0_9BACT|nr:MAG: replication and repair protein RecF protein [Candidatus Roizmanbacteria bacterium GW2011_GWA2_36_23]
MLLKQTHFRNFRNFKDEKFQINPFLTIVIGKNARGKTNLLEGIYFFINGVGFRETKEEELIQINALTAQVEGTIGEKDDINHFKISLNRQDDVEKIFYIDKTRKKHFQYLQQQMKAILFTPEQIDIILGSPSIRREYLNKLISLLDFEYKKRLSNFENALRKRNRILEQHRDIIKLQEELSFWNQYLEEQAGYITRKREEYITYLNSHPKLDSKEFSIIYAKNVFTKERIKEVFNHESLVRKTLIGPQKDDFRILLKADMSTESKNIHHFGSRSEQRLAVFWLKMNEIFYYEEFFKKRPLLLLDDVFSELDLYNKKLILDLTKKYQTVVTTTEKEIVEFAEAPKTVITLI